MSLLDCEVSLRPSEPGFLATVYRPNQLYMTERGPNLLEYLSRDDFSMVARDTILAPELQLTWQRRLDLRNLVCERVKFTSRMEISPTGALIERLRVPPVRTYSHSRP